MLLVTLLASLLACGQDTSKSENVKALEERIDQLGQITLEDAYGITEARLIYEQTLDVLIINEENVIAYVDTLD